MSKLEYYARPLVAFDATNKMHRRYYNQFMVHMSWGRCPVRFICPESNGSDLVKMIQTELLKYYVEKEFRVKKKPAKLKGYPHIAKKTG